MGEGGRQLYEVSCALFIILGSETRHTCTKQRYLKLTPTKENVPRSKGTERERAPQSSTKMNHSTTTTTATIVFCLAACVFIVSRGPACRPPPLSLPSQLFPTSTLCSALCRLDCDRYRHCRLCRPCCHCALRLPPAKAHYCCC